MAFTGRVYPWQEALWTRLLDVRRSGRLAHAYLLTGPEHLGKLDFALAFASYLLCKSPGRLGPCNQCPACSLLKASSHADLCRVEPEDSRQLRIEQVRELANWASQTAQRGGYKVAVIHPAEQMNRNAANALLKCLEEPADDTLLLLVCHQVNRLLPTIRSRCQRLEFETPGKEIALGWLAEALNKDGVGKSADKGLGNNLDKKAGKKESAEWLLSLAQGSPLKAIRVLDQTYLAGREQLINGLVDLLGQKEEAFNLAENLKDYNLSEILVLWQGFLADCIRYTCGKEEAFINNRDLVDGIRLVSTCLSLEHLFRFIDRLNMEYRAHSGVSNLNPRLSLESLLIDWSDRSDALSDRGYQG